MNATVPDAMSHRKIFRLPMAGFRSSQIITTGPDLVGGRLFSSVTTFDERSVGAIMTTDERYAKCWNDPIDHVTSLSFGL